MNKEKIIEEYFLPPFDVLLTLKDPRTYEIQDAEKQDDYLEMTGLNYEHIPHLIKILDLWLNDDLWEIDDDFLIFSPVHAWRILGQLKSEEAISPLLAMLDPMDKRGDDWQLEEFNYLFRNIGPKAIPALKNYLYETGHELFAYVPVLDCIKEIGTINEEARRVSIEILKNKLEFYEKNDKHLNSSLISCLIDLKAVETAELIERAFAAYRVDYRMEGDWGDVKKLLGVEGLGLAPEGVAQTNNPFANIFKNSFSSSNTFSRNNSLSRNQAKAKRKKGKKSRKKNRRKK